MSAYEFDHKASDQISRAAFFNNNCFDRTTSDDISASSFFFKADKKKVVSIKAPQRENTHAEVYKTT